MEVDPRGRNGISEVWILDGSQHFGFDFAPHLASLFAMALEKNMQTNKKAWVYQIDIRIKSFFCIIGEMKYNKCRIHNIAALP